MFGTNRTVAVSFKANVDGYVAGIRKAQASTEDFASRASKSATKHKADWDRIGTAALIAGGAIAAGLGLAVKRSADFEQSMSRVGAVTGASSSQMKALSEAALQAGQDTVFSAMEAAEAQAELAKAGVSTADILGGALTGALDLAAAGGLGLAQSAEIAAQAMNLFNLEGSDVTMVADTLTAAANKSAAGVDDLGQALSQGGTVAAATGLTLQETAGTLAAFADAGIKGSDAGTSLKTMLQRLNPQSKEAAAKFEELGISAYDAQGNFIGMEELAGQLETSLGGLTVQQRNAALQIMFGSDAVRAANILYQQGADGIAEYVAAVDDVGAAARMAARMTDNLKGDLESLSGAIETALIKTGSGGTEALRGLVQSIETVVNAYNKLPASTQAAVFNFGAAAAGILLVAGGAMKATTSVLAFKVSLEAAGISAGRFSGIMGGVAKGLGLLAFAGIAAELQTLIRASGVATVEVEDLSAALGDLAEGAKAVPAFGDIFESDNALGPFRREIESTEDALSKFSTQAQIAFGGGTDALERFLDGGSGVAKFEKQVSQLDAALADMVAQGNADKAAAAFEQMMAAVDPAYVDEVRAQFELYPAALDEMTVASQSAGAGQEELSENLTAAKEASQEAKDALDAYIDSMVAAGVIVLSTRQAQRDLEESIDNVTAAVEESTKAGLGQADMFDINTEQGRKNSAALDAVAQDALDLAQAIYNETGAEEDFRASLVQSRERLIAAAKQMGLSEDAAIAYADAIIDIPAAKTTTITANTGQATAAVNGITTLIRNIQGKTVTVNVRTVYTSIGTPGALSSSTTGGVTRAAGGPVFGPGTSTSDSIPAYLSTGEYVVKAAAVAKYGMRFLHDLNSMRLAGGGPVGVPMLARGGTPAAAPVAAGPNRLRLEGTLDLGDGVMGRIVAMADVVDDFTRNAPVRSRMQAGVR